MSYHKNVFALLLLLVTFSFTSCNEDDEPVTSPGRLVAFAGEDRSVLTNNEVLLDGSSSFSENNKPFTFSWMIKSKPSESAAMLRSPASEKTLFIPDVPGIYIIELQLRQESRTAVAQVVVTATSDQTNEPQTVILNENIVAPTVLEDIFDNDANPDYIVTADINVSADLTIRPGVVIMFSDHKALHIVSGKFTAAGTADKPITLKGYENRPAYWRGLVIYSNHEENTLDYVSITGAGSMPVNGSLVTASVFLDGSPATGASMSISNTTIAQGGGFGLFVSGMSSLTRFSDNTFTSNAYSAAYFPARLLYIADATTTFSGNGFDGIETYGVLDTNSETQWKKLNNASYLVSNNLSIHSGLAIDPGASLKVMPYVTIDVSDDGYLNATGTSEERIVFTAANANTYWNGLVVNTPSDLNKLHQVEISDAGFETIGAASHPSNVVVGANGKVSIKQSTIKNGLGYGVVAHSIEQVNADIISTNEFYNLAKGYIFPKTIQYPDMPSLKGEWLDQWTFQNDRTSVSQNFYDEEAGTWFEGASGPWTMTTGKGLGIVIHDDNSFVWAAAEATPWTGCENYNAEFMKGSVSWNEESITFDQTYWRSKFVNSCEPSQNGDMEIETGEISLRYEINKLYNVLTGEEYWQLKFINPDNSTFSYYRK